MTATTTARDLMVKAGKVNTFGRDREAAAEHAALAAKLNAEARENWDSDAWHRQVAADMAEMLDYGFVYDNIFGSYVQVEQVGEFDRVTIRERRGMKVFYTARGGYIEESQLRSEIWELPHDTMGFHVSQSIDKLRANFALEFGDIVTKGEERLRAEANRRLLTLVQTAIPNSSPYYVSAAGINQASLNQAIREVRDAVKPDGSGPVPVTIIGRAATIDQISDYTGWLDEAQEEIRRQGRLGYYRGCAVVQLTNYVDEDGVAYTPANELWVLGGTAGKFAFYGDMQVKSWDENTVDYRHYRSRKDVGGLIHHPEQVRRFIDTAVTP